MTRFSILCNIPRVCQVAALWWLSAFLLFSQNAQTFAPEKLPAKASNAQQSRQRLIAYSKQYIGTPYKIGGTDATGMDCSGFLNTVTFGAIGVRLPRTVSALYASIEIIADSEKEPGDILFFRTVDSRVSHAALYLGNDQFIHSASDGPNTGVIISSLNESYWKRTYSGVGRILPPVNPTPNPAAFDYSDAEQDSDSSASENTDNSKNTGKKSGNGASAFWTLLDVDATLTADWNFFSSERFMLLSRGVTLFAHVLYTAWDLRPGFGLAFSYDPAVRLFRIPVVFSLSLTNGLRIYAGPIFSIGNATLPDTETRISPSIFPGIIGVSWQSPSFKAGKTRIAFVQDIHYAVLNKTDKSALAPLESIAAGLVFSTGARVILPLAEFR